MNLTISWPVLSVDRGFVQAPCWRWRGHWNCLKETVQRRVAPARGWRWRTLPLSAGSGLWRAA